MEEIRSRAIRAGTASTLSLCLIVVATATPARPATAAPASATPAPVQLNQPARPGPIALPFLENAGEADVRVRFYAPVLAGTLFVTSEGALVYSLPARRYGPAAVAAATGDPGLPDGLAEDGWTLVESFIDGRPRVGPGERSAVNVSRFVGDASTHRASVPAYAAVGLGEVYPGIDVRLGTAARNVEKIFTIGPGADPSRIAIRVDGATGLAAGADGSLVARTGRGDVVFSPPLAFQDIDGHRHDVGVAYALGGDGMRYGFAVGRYDARYALVIDPLVQSTFLGSAGDDRIYAMAMNPLNGEVLVAGATTSTTFPGTSGGAQPAHAFEPAGFFDGFVARLLPDLKTLLQATYIGGNGLDMIRGMAVYPTTGEVFVGGTTASANFPGTAGGFQTGKGAGDFDAFIAHLNPTLTSLVQSTYFGTGTLDVVRSIAFDTAAGHLVAGGATSNGFVPFGDRNGCDPFAGKQGFVTRLSLDLAQVYQSICLGGSNDDVYAVLVHPMTLDVYAAGTYLGNAAVTRLYSGLIGVLEPPLSLATGAATAIVVDPENGNLLVTGSTTSAALPGTVNGAQPAHASDAGQNDAFVARIAAAPIKLVQATYLGGNGEDAGEGILIHPVNRSVYITGYTNSVNLPLTAGSIQPAHADPSLFDAFVTRLTGDLTRVIRSTYLGGTLTESPNYILGHAGTSDVFVSGQTTSRVFPGTAGGAQPVHGADTNNLDGFVTRMTADLTAVNTTPPVFAFAPQFNVPPDSLRTSEPVQIAGIAGSADIYIDGRFGSEYCVASTPNCTACDVSLNYIRAPGTIANGKYVCVRHYAGSFDNQLTTTNVHVGGAFAQFAVTTGTLLGGGCSLDIDGNTTVDALTDGLLLLRAMFGLTGTAVTTGALGSGATRTSWGQIQSYLNGNCGTSFAP